MRYQSCTSDAPIYLHPRSALHRAAPDYVAYAGLLATEKRTYMHGVTAIEPEWPVDTGGALARLSAPLAQPPPAYNAKRDAVLAWCEAAYGTHSWPLPLHAGA